ncbi:MAG: winged helix-turn-helix transcriptional regulator [Succinivibrio sp.]|nr:winged helix-turn-helix transcriptional regulator [Succinivibrio sp.]
MNTLKSVNGPSTFPISYHGEFFYRSGSTNQKLTGIALTDFISRKNGILWEDATVNEVSIDDLDDESFKIFRREALRKKRMTEAELNVSNRELLEKLHLMRDGKLTRAAVLLFYKDPSIVQVGSFIKVGKFDESGLVVYHHELEESFIVNATKVVDLIYLMYLKAKISYEHDMRVEEYPFAREAIREAIYNAIAHNCYMYGSPIQIKVSEDSLTIGNRCILPEGWTVDTFMQAHDSEPYNPNIANVFYRAGFIESWGQGIQKICKECSAIGEALPEYELIGTSLRVKFKALESALIIDPQNQGIHNTTSNEPNYDPNRDPNDLNRDPNSSGHSLDEQILSLIKKQGDITRARLSLELGVSESTIKRAFKKLLTKGIITRIGNKRSGYWKVN